MLSLQVEVGGRVMIGPDVWIELVEVRTHSKIVLGFNAPDDVRIMREALLPANDPRRTAFRPADTRAAVEALRAAKIERLAEPPEESR